MRKIVANFFISLDGVVERPDQWHFPYFNDEMGEVVGAGMAASDTMLLGRKTYEEFASYWPSQTEPPADHMNGIQKVVVSTTLERADWQNSTLVRGNVPDSDHYAYKLAWLAALKNVVGTGPQPAIVCGDINIAPTDADVFDPAA